MTDPGRIASDAATEKILAALDARSIRYGENSDAIATYHQYVNPQKAVPHRLCESDLRTVISRLMHLEGAQPRIGDPNRMCTVAEVAALTGVAKMTLYRLIHRGDLPWVRTGTGGLYRIHLAEAVKLLGGKSQAQEKP